MPDVVAFGVVPAHPEGLADQLRETLALFCERHADGALFSRAQVGRDVGTREFSPPPAPLALHGERRGRW